MPCRKGSPDPGGLPATYIVKAAIPIGFTLLLLQGYFPFVKIATHTYP